LQKEHSSLPLFPLSIVVFPGETTKLHIFEPRYKQLITECFENGTTFGIPPYIEGKSLTTGTELKVAEISHIHSDGNMDVVCTAVGWFMIHEFYKQAPDKLYPYGIIERQPWDDTSDVLLSIQIISLIQELYKLMNIHQVKIPEAHDIKSYHLVHKMGLSIHQELDLLHLSHETDKQMYIIQHLENLIPILREAETMRKRAEMNGHFQNLIPPF
jgi:Lon protease-like protein